MIDPLALVALALLVVGVVGSVLPLVPGALASLGGVLLYWWVSGFTSPSPLVLVALLALGVLALATDWFAGAMGAAAGGASGRTTAASVVVGILLFLVAGPIGLLVGVPVTVFGLEYYRHGDADASVRAAGYATVSALASGVVQVVLTGTLLVAMLWIALF